jgi:hypothetical protein
MNSFRAMAVILLLGAAPNVLFMTSLGAPLPLCLVISAFLALLFFWESLRQRKNSDPQLKRLTWPDLLWLAFCNDILESSWSRQLVVVNRFERPVRALLLKLE